MNIGILLAAGESKRFCCKSSDCSCGHEDKLFCDLNGKPVIYYSLKFLEESKFIDKIFVVTNKENKQLVKELVANKKFKKVEKVVRGGSTRYESVCNATKEISKIKNAKFLIIHNAANPLATQKELAACFKKLTKNTSGVAVGRKIQATIKQIKGNFVEKNIPRESLFGTETPQVVKSSDFIAAQAKFPYRKFNFTDDLAVLEYAGYRTAVCDAFAFNKKITTEEDLEVMRAITEGSPVSVGIGEDSHKFSNSGCLILGGIKIKNLPKLEAQSDGDIIIHALCNALSSAVSGGSLGTFATKMCKSGIKNSAKYLEKIMEEIYKRKLSIEHLAISIEAQKPAIDPLSGEIKRSLAKLLQINEENIGITATSGEELTSFGRGEAIKCHAVVLLKRQL